MPVEENNNDMDTQNEEFSPEQSLRLIQRMIDNSRQTVFKNSRYFLLWGWCSFAASIGQFVLKAIFHSPYHPAVWWIVLPCLAITWYWTWKNGKNRRAKTYVNEMMGYLWGALTLAYFAMSIIFARLGWEFCYPFFMILYGIGTYISGKILQFRLFVWGGLVSFLLAAVSIWFDFDFQALFAAAAIFISYILPGHLFRIRNERTK